MQSRPKELGLEKRLTPAGIQARTNIDFRILENFEKGLENGVCNSLAIWQKSANSLKVPIEYLMGLNDGRKILTVSDLNLAKEDAYGRITDIPCEDEDDEDEQRINQGSGQE